MFDLDRFRASHAARSRLLCRARVGDHDLEVREAAGLRWFTAGGNFVQSLLRLDRPDTVVLPNQLTMLAALTWRGLPRRVLNLGSGIGVFERFFRAHLAATALVSVEVSAAMVGIARAWFGFAPDWPVVIAPAADYLAMRPAHFDLVLCDIFAGEHHPDCLFDAYFHADLAACLRPRGVLALNVSPPAADELDAILGALRQALEWVELAPVPGHGNVIVLASPRRPPDDAVRAARAARLATRFDLPRACLLPACQRLPSRREVLRGAAAA